MADENITMDLTEVVESEEESGPLVSTEVTEESAEEPLVSTEVTDESEPELENLVVKPANEVLEPDPANEVLAGETVANEVVTEYALEESAPEEVVEVKSSDNDLENSEKLDKLEEKFNKILESIKQSNLENLNESLKNSINITSNGNNNERILNLEKNYKILLDILKLQNNRRFNELIYELDILDYHISENYNEKINEYNDVLDNLIKIMRELRVNRLNIFI